MMTPASRPPRFAPGDIARGGFARGDAVGVLASRRFFAGFPGFAVATLALTALAGWALTLGFRGPGDVSAIAVSGGVALVVQLGSFPVVRELALRNLMLG